MNCLMIETRDRRKFFTHEKNFPLLIDFARTFDAEISVVRLDEGQVLELAELAPALCDASYRRPKSNYEIIETKLVPRANSRSSILRTAEKIREYIIEKLMSGGMVSISDLKIKFKRYKLTAACYCNHIKRAIKELKSKNVKIIKIGAGKYKVQK